MHRTRNWFHSEHLKAEEKNHTKILSNVPTYISKIYLEGESLSGHFQTCEKVDFRCLETSLSGFCYNFWKKPSSLFHSFELISKDSKQGCFWIWLENEFTKKQSISKTILLISPKTINWNRSLGVNSYASSWLVWMWDL